MKKTIVLLLFLISVKGHSQLADNIVLNAGATFKKLKSHNYKYLTDLLGGTYFDNVDPFGTNSQQNSTNLDNTNTNIGVGDTYGYNYNLLATVVDAFTQFKFTYKKVDFYLAQTYARSEYQREGLYRNGYYATNSLGKSDNIIFENFGFKGGLTYKISGRQFLNFNSVYMTQAPTLKNTFPNVRINNNIVTDLKSENISGVDASYIIKAPKFKSRITAYYSKIKNATETSFFFADGVAVDDGNPDTANDPTSAFVAETVTNIDKKQIGLELGMEYQVTSTIKAILSAGYGEYTYDNNPNVSINIDALASPTNIYPEVSYGRANLKDYKQKLRLPVIWVKMI